MSRLRIFNPEPDTDYSVDGPTVISFQAHFKRVRGNRLLRVLQRARQIHENRVCPYCNGPAVVPLELRDAVFARNRLPVPGTATLVGFHCETCGSEWPLDRDTANS